MPWYKLLPCLERPLRRGQLQLGPFGLSVVDITLIAALRAAQA